MMEKILIIKKTKNSNIFKYLDFKDVESYYISNKENIIFKIFRKSHSFLFSIFFGNWKKKLTKYDKVILFDNGFQNIIAKYIKSKNPNIKIILWFWNPVISSSQLFLNNKYIDELWTYSKQDAKKYNMNDLYTQLRSKDIRSIEEVEYAILETNGNLSVFTYEENQDNTFPLPLIISGQIDYEALKLTGKNKKWLKNELKKQGLESEKEVYGATLSNNSLKIVKFKNQKIENKN